MIECVVEYATKNTVGCIIVNIANWIKSIGAIKSVVIAVIDNSVIEIVVMHVTGIISIYDAHKYAFRRLL